MTEAEELIPGAVYYGTPPPPYKMEPWGKDD